ncbi:MAG: 2'-5' RNA ligase family protein [Deltaproteobacteria bacterium]
MSRPPSTGLIVPVEAARLLLAPWRQRLPAAGRSLPPHVTALWPFLPVDAVDAAVEGRLDGLLAGVPAFTFALTRIAELADAVVLVPEPAEPFAALTRLFWDEWPECPPFGGAYEDVAPHVVVAVDPAPADRAAIEAALAPLLPLAARATEVLLVEEAASGALRERRRFSLGS